MICGGIDTEKAASKCSANAQGYREEMIEETVEDCGASRLEQLPSLHEGPVVCDGLGGRRG